MNVYKVMGIQYGLASELSGIHVHSGLKMAS